LFLLGLGSFLIAHLIYIAMFARYRMAGWRRPGAVRISGIGLIAGVLWAMLTVLWPSLGTMRVPVVVYALVLSGMTISAMLAELGTPLAAVGALLFLGSDAMLAVSTFSAPFAGSGPLIWITYYAAQVLMLGGMWRHFRYGDPFRVGDVGRG
jgi:uncharacterized membrane protein YhhN